MTSVDELLDITAESKVCIIDPDTRIITVPSCYAEFGVESDEKVSRINFQCPRIVGDNIDLTTFNLYINYLNGGGQGNAYLIDDVAISGNNITFSWLLSRHVTEKSGTVKYIVCAKKSDGVGVINEWNTKVATGLVNGGLEVVAEIEEQSADIIEQILVKISDSYSKSETDTLLASAGKVKTVNGVEPDANGNITISTAGGTQITDDGSGNITITCMAADVTATDDGSGNITLGGA